MFAGSLGRAHTAVMGSSRDSATLRTGSRVENRGFWFGPADRPTMGWLTRIPTVAVRSGVVIAPPTGYPYWSCHQTLRAMAERLAEMGHVVLRFDYDGTGDSAGDQWDQARVAAWRESLRGAVGQLRALGATEITVIGARIGGTLALVYGAEMSVDRIVAWLPVSRGSRYSREIRLLSEEVPSSYARDRRGTTRVAAGTVFSDETLRDLDQLSIGRLKTPPARGILVLDDENESSASTVAHLRGIGAAVDQVSLEACRTVLETPPEFRPSGAEIVERACDWLGDAPPATGRAELDLPVRATMIWRGHEVEEEVLELGKKGYAAVLTSPPSVSGTQPTLVLLNTGSETHVGTGRAWVEYARDLATCGYRTIRVDFLGWGESPTGPRGPGRPYDAECVPDTLSIVDELRARTAGPLAVCGLCASAWVALAAARDGSVDAVIAINPQLYWRPGDPVEIDWDLIRSRRSMQIRAIDLGARLRVWSLLDLLRVRSAASRWLEEVVSSGTRIEMIFTESDDGLIYLRQRLGRHLRRLIREEAIGLQELPGLDHPMHRTWLRPLVVDALKRALDGIAVHARPSTHRGRDHICHRSSSTKPMRR